MTIPPCNLIQRNAQFRCCPLTQPLTKRKPRPLPDHSSFNTNRPSGRHRLSPEVHNVLSPHKGHLSPNDFLSAPSTLIAVSREDSVLIFSSCPDEGRCENPHDFNLHTSAESHPHTGANGLYDTSPAGTKKSASLAKSRSIALTFGGGV